MTDLDTLTLNCFIAVAETGSFTKASARINRTQSAVSQQIAKLELSLGKPLFVRGKNFSLTADGEIFYGYAQRICDLQRQALSRFSEQPLAGQIRFGLPEDFAAICLTDLLVDFVHIYPDILLNIECDLTLNLFARFKQNDFDMVLVKMNKPEDFPHGVEVWSEQLEWVCNKNFMPTFAEKKPIPLVLSPPPCLYRARAFNTLEHHAIKWQLVFSSTSYASKIAAVNAGLGITILPRSMVPRPLMLVANDMLPPLSDIHISLLKHKKNDAVIDCFEQFILKKLQHSQHAI